MGRIESSRSTGERRRARGAWLLGAGLVALSGSPVAHAASPALEQVLPRGARRGQEVTLTLRGARLFDSLELLFYEDGIAVEELSVADPKEATARVRIAEDCRLGEHALRLRTASGITELRTFFVGSLPDLEEKEPNSELSDPQQVSLGGTVSGVVQNEDVDYFAFQAKKGQRVTAEIEAMRLGGEVFDPYVAILDSRRFELVACDDAPLLGQDAVASALIPEDGMYVVEVREASYGGGGGALYRLHLGTFPRPLAVYPPGGKAGEEQEVVFLGDVGGEIRQTVKAPPSGVDELGLHAEDGGGLAPSPNPFRVSMYPNALESEPNDRREEASTGDVPGAFNGILSREGDADFFRFECEKGQVLEVHVYGRRIGSPVDSVLEIQDAGGKGLVSNDDAVGPDSYARFTSPEKGTYYLRVTDHLGRGGPCNVYRVELTPVEPRISLSFPKVRQYSQDGQVVAVPRGNRYAAMVAVDRSEFGGDVILRATGVPTGLAVTEVSVAGNIREVPVLFEAAADAPIGGGLFDLVARPTEEGREIPSVFLQEVELVVGNPGQSVYWMHRVGRPAIAVAEEAPFEVRIVEPKAPLVQGGSMSLKVVAERKDGFKTPIRLELPFRPPGVSSPGGVDIAEGQSEASIPLTANGRAAVGEWRIVVNATADAGRGPVSVSSQLASLRVAEPFFTLELDRGAVEQGAEGGIVFKAAQQAPFEGAAKVELVGLPPKVTAKAIEITRETAEGVLQVAADPESPPGRHKNLFCRVELLQDGEPVVFSTGGTELRIDRPPPPKPAAAPEREPEKEPEKDKAEPEKKPDPPVEKPLTRLEKLRLEARERLEGPKTETEG